VSDNRHPADPRLARGDNALGCSVIVPSFRSAATIGACLSALFRQEIALPYEVIVVDSSPDETPDIIRRDFPAVRLVHLPQRADPASARNIGARAARGAVLAFIDSDCVAAPDWLSRLLLTLECGYDAAGGAIANANGETLVSWAGYMCEFREFLPGSRPRDVANLTLGNVAYRRDAFWRCGGFSPGCFPQEDQVLHHGLRARGGRLRYDPRIVVAHAHRSDRAAFLQHQRRIGRANARVARRLQLPGSGFARRPWLIPAVLPALLSLRFARTVHACRHVERGLLLRRLRLAWLCWLGMCWWGMGFLEGAACDYAYR
jgi:glycosyltransferase involved in cell wall biosynthesis